MRRVVIRRDAEIVTAKLTDFAMGGGELEVRMTKSVELLGEKQRCWQCRGEMDQWRGREEGKVRAGEYPVEDEL